MKKLVNTFTTFWLKEHKSWNPHTCMHTHTHAHVVLKDVVSAGVPSAPAPSSISPSRLHQLNANVFYCFLFCKEIQTKAAVSPSSSTTPDPAVSGFDGMYAHSLCPFLSLSLCHLLQLGFYPLQPMAEACGKSRAAFQTVGHYLPSLS